MISENFVDGIYTSKIDKKSYRFLELPNKLKILIIEDNTLNYASAAMNVNTGSWNDPDEFEGLAHFLEHMLFQGSSKYQGINYYSGLMSKYGGSGNAYTS
jgi:insulysin